jgi:AcrR family transcriptional regulator
MQRTGRPRNPDIDGAILDAAVDVLSEVGYARLTIEAVARRAETTKPSVYRRWRGRQHLVLAALARGHDNDKPAPDSGCVVCDLTDCLDLFTTTCRRMPPDVLASLLTDCAAEPDLRANVMATLFEPARRTADEVLVSAQKRGDLRADLDRGLAVDLLGSLVHYRALFGHAPTDRAEVEAAVTTLLRGMAEGYRGHPHSGMTN